MSNQAGLSVMYEGLVITKVSIDTTHLHVDFDNGKQISIWDNGQSCCENRYMSTDDDIQSLVGGKLLHVMAKDGPSIDEEFDCHEQCFVEVATDKGLITLVNHNEHNGYYGGFELTITERS